MKKLILCLLATAMLCLTACKPEIETNVSLVAAADIDCQITINEDGTINDTNSNNEYFDFSDWTEIKSVSASQFCFGGIKEDGSVMVTTYSSFELDVSDWTDIKMLEFSFVSAYGLKGDGTVLCASSQDSASEINEKVSQWTDIVYINTCFFGIVGVKKDGTVVAALSLHEELEEEVEEWTDIKTASISTSGLRARIVGHKNNGELLEVQSDELYKYQMDSYEELTGAVKICAGDWFIAGLMSDGTLKVKCGDDYDQQSKYQQEGIDYINLKLLDNEKDIVDINCFAEVLVALKKDGTVLVGGCSGD